MSDASGNNDIDKHTTTSVDSTPVKSRGIHQRKFQLLGAVGLLIAVLAVGYFFLIYRPNTPDEIYKTSLNRSGQGYERLTNYTKAQEKMHYKGGSVDGSFKVSTASTTIDGTLSGQSSNNDAQAKLTLDVGGKKVTANLRSLVEPGQTQPDVYLQATGVDSLLGDLSGGASSPTTFDGQWISIDHTLLDTLSQQAGSTTTTAPTSAEINNALTKISQVNKQYLLSTNQQNNVLIKKDNLGTSTQDGRTVQGYKMAYNKQHLQTYITALGNALDTSSLNDWSQQTFKKPLSSELELNSVHSAISNADAGYTFTMYVDTSSKLPHKLHFPDKSSINNYLEAGLNYHGGDNYPFTLAIASKDGTSTDNARLTFTLNTKDNTASLDGNIKQAGVSNSVINFKFNVTPSNKSVNVIAPPNAKPLMDIINGLGLSNLFSYNGSPTSTGSSTESTPANDDPMTFQN